MGVLWDRPILSSAQPKVKKLKWIEKNSSQQRTVLLQNLGCLVQCRMLAVFVASPHWTSVVKFIYCSFDDQKCPGIARPLLGVKLSPVDNYCLWGADPNWPAFPSDNQVMKHNWVTDPWGGSRRSLSKLGAECDWSSFRHWFPNVTYYEHLGALKILIPWPCPNVKLILQEWGACRSTIRIF